MNQINQAIQLTNAIEIQNGSTVSKTLHQDGFLKTVLFAFDAGQELSEHTAAVPAIMHFLDGEANVTVGDQKSDAVAGSYYYMQANVPHGIAAIKPTRMLLHLLKGAKSNA
ncbi:Cupin domain protein [Stieleria maiorica]|uniref:Cupin domain protein n=1 Tax=Stieleria maiorica TaxID=2795974 RepID=A0A5B9MAR1_9BACT|nr:cupin domain-containing protein [Stieleria maiorica]QEF97783.1 Cupin domain protein [Stieleria maiorica]